MTRRMSSRQVAVGASMAFSLALMGMTAGCGSDEAEDGHFYCTDAQGQIVAEEFCDEPNDSNGGGGGFFFAYIGSSVHAPPAGRTSYPVGHKLPANVQKFKNTSANRTTLGLPARGRISNGTVKPNVVGKGGAAVKGGGKVGGGSGKGSGGG